MGFEEVRLIGMIVVVGMFGFCVGRMSALSARLLTREEMFQILVGERVNAKMSAVAKEDVEAEIAEAARRVVDKCDAAHASATV